MYFSSELSHAGLGLQRLPKDILEKPDFESYFVGAESKIDQVLSSTWLKAHTKHWTWKNYIMANTPRCGACGLATTPWGFNPCLDSQASWVAPSM